jgi:hypothetical protein
MMTAAALWACLRRVRSLRFVARSGRPGGWNGVGVGEVVVEPAGGTALTFTEAGEWRPESGRPTRFRNVFRWSQTGPAAVSLEHLRFGPGQPVYLFDLAPSAGGVWSSVSPHLCSEDCYAAELRPHEGGFFLRWSIAGPRKAETVEYSYFWGEGNAESGAV